MQPIHSKYAHEFSIARTLALLAGGAILEERAKGLSITIKPDGSKVTQADVRANTIIVEGLQKEFPQYTIVSEESQDVLRDAKKPTWYIDPLDGTRGFVEGSTEFAVHIGLADNGRPVLGIVYRPCTDELYVGIVDLYAWKEQNGKVERFEFETEATISSNTRRMLCSSGVHQQYMDPVIPLFLPTTIIHCNGFGLRLMKLLENHADFYVNKDSSQINTWDICAPEAILQSAKIPITFVDGREIRYFGQHIMGTLIVTARTQQLYQEILSICKQNGLDQEKIVQ